MQLARLLNNNYPYKTNVPVYDAANLVNGELLMRHASWGSANKYYITAYTGANTEAEDTIGITQASADNCTAFKENSKLFNLGSDTLPDAGPDTGGNFMPVIVNPDATYFAFYDQTDAINQTGAVSASTAWAITSLEDNIDAGWLFTTDQADSAATYVGVLRYGTASASGTLTADSALTVDTSSDVVKVLPIGHRLVGLNAESTGLTTTAAAASTIYLEVAENWMRNDGAPTHPMRYWEDKGLDDLTGLVVEAELIQLKHAWRYVVV